MLRVFCHKHDVEKLSEMSESENSPIQILFGLGSMAMDIDVAALSLS